MAVPGPNSGVLVLLRMFGVEPKGGELGGRKNAGEFRRIDARPSCTKLRSCTNSALVSEWLPVTITCVLPPSSDIPPAKFTLRIGASLENVLLKDVLTWTPT